MTAPSPITVSFETYQSTYVYSPTKLWISYGIAIAFAAFAIMIGMVSIHVNRASYSNAFSTIMLASRSAELGVEIAGEGQDGANPLPKYIAEARISFVGVESASGPPTEEETSGSKDAKAPTATSALLSSSDEDTTSPSDHQTAVGRRVTT